MTFGNMVVNIKLRTKHFPQIPVQTKMFFKNVFKNSHPFTKGLFGACMRILNFLTIQHHTTAKDKFIHVLQEQYTTQKEQHSIITEYQTVGVSIVIMIS